ncbi:MAG: hypothetical protein PHH37_00060 [Paludibacter sp.]|nr:hypothetical protein [Paludibacter sp.]
MNTTYSMNRVGLLLKRFFIENKQKELTFWGISIAVFVLFHNPVTLGFYLIISGFIFAARLFKDFDYTSGGMHYLLIPATHAEKLTTAFILNTFYYFIMIIIVYVVGAFLGTHLGNMIFGTNNEVNLIIFNFAGQHQEVPFGGNNSGNVLDLFRMFAVSQSIFTLGAIYFRRNVVGKTFLAIIAFAIIIGIFEYLFVKYGFNFDEFKNGNIHINMFDIESVLPDYKLGAQVLNYITIPFFWIVSYFRLTEKEV